MAHATMWSRSNSRERWLVSYGPQATMRYWSSSHGRSTPSTSFSPVPERGSRAMRCSGFWQTCWIDKCGARFSVPTSTYNRLVYATPEGTRRYIDRFREFFAAGFYRTIFDLRVSTLGIGTYLGQPDEITDRKYTDAVLAAVEGGINFIDTAINYRHQRSE